MTIERVVERRGKVKSITDVVPGFEEQLSPTRGRRIWPSFAELHSRETWIKVLDDDSAQFTYQTRLYDGEKNDRVSAVLAKTLTRNEINDHSIASQRTLFGTQISYRWIPTITTVSPEQEMALSELREKGGYTPQQLQDIREHMIYDAQQSRKLPPHR